MQDKKLWWLNRLSTIAGIIALIVIALGGLTRLLDAGLGCPDWPGCYGHLSVPQSVDSHNWQAPLVVHKAWMEMIHRYFAGTLALLVISVAFLSVSSAARYGVSYFFGGLLLFALVVYQALLGMWTVTLKLLPIVVTQHLLGGMSLLALLWWLRLKSRDGTVRCLSGCRNLRYFAGVGLVLVFFQIALGAWTSTNYATLSCDSFPFCRANIIMPFNFSEAFTLFSSSDINYEGGVLTESARQTIQMTHRIIALLVSLYLLIFSWRVLRQTAISSVLRRTTYILPSLLLLQIFWGIGNVLFHLPVPLAILHNVTAAGLLCVMVSVNFYLRNSICPAR